MRAETNLRIAGVQTPLAEGIVGEFPAVMPLTAGKTPRGIREPCTLETAPTRWLARPKPVSSAGESISITHSRIRGSSVVYGDGGMSSGFAASGVS